MSSLVLSKLNGNQIEASMSGAKTKESADAGAKKTKIEALNPPNTKNTLKVANDLYEITHYTYAMEDDVAYANDELVDAKGLNEKHKYGFLFGKAGVIMQGTGLASNGQYITIDWKKGKPQGTKTTFKYGTGLSADNLVPWETVAADLAEFPRGTKLKIDIYKDKGTFIVRDTGGRIMGKHLDVFVGAVSIAEANKLGKKKSKVTKVG